jgi:hypothetical protein
MVTKLMTKWQLATGLCVLTAGLALPAENGAKDQVRVTKTERLDFQSGGTIRINNAHADLNVEGWDRPEVEITVNKSTQGLYTSKEAEGARKRLDLIAVKVDRKSPTDLTLSTTFPRRTLSRLNRGASDLILEYQVHVPRDSHLIVHHGTGAVLITGVNGDMDASVGTGDIVLLIPGSEQYSIDAKAGLGTVDSDFGASAGHRLAGRQLAFAPASPKHKAVLRVGVGGISVKEMPTDGKSSRK